MPGKRKVEVEEPEELEEYHVEQVLDHRLKLGALEYLIKWLSYGPEYNTWEPETNTENCPDKVKLYWDLYNSHKRNLSLPPNSFPNKTINENKFWSTFAAEFREAGFQLVDTVDSGDGTIEARVVICDRDLVDAQFEEQERKLAEWQRNVQSLCLKANEAKIFIENKVDGEGPPDDFTYVTDYVTGPNVAIPSEPIVYCHCERDPLGKWQCGKYPTCCPALNESQFAYHPSSSRVSRRNEGTAIYECNSKCSCGPDCSNRVVQNGRQIPLTIFKTVNRGWGVRATRKIIAGDFVTEYIGQVITIEEAKRRERSQDPAIHSAYLFDLDFGVKPQYSIDAKNIGNVAHFINHSCDPNMQTRSVWIESQESSMPRLAFFALRDIVGGEELTFDYAPPGHAHSELNSTNDSIDSLTLESSQSGVTNHLKCHCGSKKCRGTLLVR